MNPAAQTDTRIHRPPHVVKHLASQAEEARAGHVARHSTGPQHARTEVIPAVKVRAAMHTSAPVRVNRDRVPVPLPSRPAVPERREAPAHRRSLFARIRRLLGGQR